jgi:hypothetical protein
MTALQWISAIGSVATLLVIVFGACWWVVRHSMSVQRFALESISALQARIAALELQAINRDGLDSALEKALSKVMQQIERRLDGMEDGLKAATRDLHQVRLDVAILKDREGGTDYSERNRALMEALRNG